MQTRYRRVWRLASICTLAATAAGAGYIDHNFDSAPFTLGLNFTNPVQGWQASTSSVAVANDKSYSGSQSVRLSEGGTFSNVVAQSGPSVVWTDLRLAPTLGYPPDLSLTNGASFLSYFDTNGCLNVWNGGGWLVCATDVWGNAVPPVTSGVFAEISVSHNFALQRIAVLLNDRVVLQDLPFASAAAAYNVLGICNTSSNAWLDDAYVQATYAASRLTNDYNGVDGADALELQTYGYVARTLKVGVGQPYASLASALAVARDRDWLWVGSGTLYGDTVTITQNLTIVGGVFTNSGVLTVAAGKTVTVAVGFTSSLTVSGTVALAQGVTVSGAAVTVSGTISVATNNAQLLAGNLNLIGSGTVVDVGGRVADAGAGVDMTGGFTLDAGTWHAPAVASLDFVEDFERYADNTQVQSLGFRGWGASATDVLVMAGQGYGNSKGLVLPSGDLVSNRITTAQTRVWTDFRVKPVLGLANPALSTNTAFLCYVATDGFLNVWSAGAWSACTNYVNGDPVQAMSTDAYARVTAFLNFETHEAAVFIGGKLVREGVGFPAGATIPSFSRFAALNGSDIAFLDNVDITMNFPADLTADLDGDGIPDALEMQRYGTLAARPTGTVFRFR